MRSRKIPIFYCPFPSIIHPQVEEARRAALQWAQRFRLAEKPCAWQRLDGTRLDVLAARAYPEASFDQLVLATEWMIWYFQFDDQFDEGALGHQPERVYAILQSLLDSFSLNPLQHSYMLPACPEDAIYASLSDLWLRTQALASIGWQVRFIQHMAGYFGAHRREAENRAARGIPDMDAYIRTRHHSGGVPPSIALLEAFCGIELPAPILTGEPFQTLWNATVNTVCWSNDIFSLAKELARGDVNNLVMVVQRDHQCSWEEAIALVNDMFTRQVERFIDAEKRLFDHFPYVDHVERAVRYCVNGMRSWIRGNIDWSLIAYRYNVVEETPPNQPVSYLETLLKPASLSVSER